MADTRFIAEGGIQVPNTASNSSINNLTIDNKLTILGDITSNGNVTLGNTTGTVTVSGGSANITANVYFSNTVYFANIVSFAVPPTFVGAQVANGDIRPFSNTTFSLGNTYNVWLNVYANTVFAYGSAVVGNVTIAAVGTVSVGNSTVNSFINTTSISVGSASINSTAFSGTSNNASYLGGTAASSYALKTYADSAANTAYTNAIAIAANGSNITSGTVANARLSAGNTTIAGVLQLVDSVSNTSSAFAATANSVKTVYDLAVGAGSAATAYSNAVSNAAYQASVAYSNAVAVAANGTNISSGTVAGARLPASNTSQAGIVQLNDSTSSISVVQAATANAVTAAFNNGGTAYSNAVANTTAMLNVYAGTSNVVTVGNVVTGRWSATIVEVAKGGTGNSSFTAGLLYASTTSPFITANSTHVVNTLGSTNVANATYATSSGSSTNSTFATTAGALTTANSYQVTALGVGTAPGTSGTIRATGDITAYYSDMRLKDFDGPITSALSKVNYLRGFYYRGNAKAKELGFDTDKVEVGVSAQEVNAVLPEIIRPAPVDPQYMTLDYGRLVPLLIEAIKELTQKVESLEHRLPQ